MKKFYLFLSLALLWSVASARQINESEARNIAATRLPALSQSASRVHAKGITTGTTDDTAVYMFNCDKGGFAIIAGDDRMPNMILAYSSEGNLDLDNCPAAMRAWLDDVTMLIAQGEFSRAGRSTLDYSNPVQPLVTTKWDQDSPYNLLTPAGTNVEHCPTGCVATAMAQVMNYWKYPTDGGLCEHSYTWKGQTLGVDFRESRYDWANMADVYDDSSTEEQNNAVAKLMWDCGVATDMIYDDKMSSSNDCLSSAAMVDIFGYSKAATLCKRMAFTDDEWFVLVKSELDEGHPLIYMGATITNEGHAFVCDGYDTDGLYHINWGWGGLCDGYFDLNTLSPQSQGTGGAASGEGFCTAQSILSGARPPHDGDVAVAGWDMGVYRFYITRNDSEGTEFGINPTCWLN